MSTNVKRVYGKERYIGNVVFDEENKKVFIRIELGFFGRQDFELVKNEDETFNIIKTIFNKTENSSKDITFGKLFPAKNKEGQIVQGISKGSLGLLKEFNKEAQKNMIVNNDVLLISTHKLKEKVKLGDSNFWKIGYIKGIFGLEENNENSNYENEEPIETDFKNLEILDEEIPF